MKTIKHPSEYIVPELVNVIRNHAGEAEQLKQLHPAQLEVIYDQRWFQLFVPIQYHGLGLDLPEALRLEEALAWTDGSIGWTVTLCGGAGWFIGFLNPGVVSNVFGSKAACIAGSGKSSGIAKTIADGYEITGHWDYATGANYATAFTANCIIEQDGILLENTDGSPVVQSFLFLKDEVTLHENWQSMGMIATGSHSFEVKKISVSTNRSFLIDNRYAVLKYPVFQYPFLQFAETTLAVNSSGMAIRFLELGKILFEQKSNDVLLSVLKKAEKEIEETRRLFYSSVADSWEECLFNFCIAPSILHDVSVVSKQLAIVSRKVVDELYPYCGMQAANPETEINRVWRNIHTASQHSLFNR